uniref:G-protein coupled receptors family 1 profile domain-containing protein n=1 Tax=Ditylenchus dipsaci TaxID=166011 RepID=A0A915E8L2_9BILA
MTSNQTSSGICQSAELLSQSCIYKIVISFKGAANITAVFILIFLAFSRNRLKVFHPNTKTIYIFICLSTFVMALNGSTFCLFEILRLSPFNASLCGRLWWTPLIFYFRYAHRSVELSVNCSLIVLCIERFICIRKISCYEESSRPLLVAFFLIFLPAEADG